MQTANYDPEADIALFRINGDPIVRGERQNWGGVYRYNNADEVVQVEIWFAANSLPEWLIAVLPGRTPERRS
ncbi:MAG TPA: DUF2283 domain-containing protein [Solirubrobacterales bacterium]